MAYGKKMFEMALCNPNKSVDESVDNTQIRAYATRLWVDREGTGNVHIGASYSDYPPGNMGTGVNGGSITESNVSYVGDANFDNSDIPLAGNQLIDAGDPDEAQGLDYKGHPLV